jgi:hypothetical protein
MTYGFKFGTGPLGDVTTIESAESSPGVLLDTFIVNYSSGTSEIRSYPSFPGNTLFVYMNGYSTYSTYNAFYSQTSTINNLTKTVTITNETGANDYRQGSVKVTVVGF